MSDKPSEERRHKPDFPAHEVYLKGRYHLEKNTPEAFDRSAEYFNQAVLLDPDYAEPHIAG
jgi:hypothetical protein